jgi:transcriptional regulator with AAA-type ATPase domain
LTPAQQRAKGGQVDPPREQASTGSPAVISVAGNIRELENVIERSLILCDTDELTVDESWLPTKPAVDSRQTLSRSIAAHEKAIVEDALRVAGGRVFGRRERPHVSGFRARHWNRRFAR